MIVQAILVVLCSVLYGIYALSKSKFDYWKKKNVPYKKPTPIFGNYGKFMLFKRSLAEVAEDISKEFPNEPYVGTFYGSEPALLLRDPSFIKTVMTKDFYYFSSRENDKYTHKELFTQNVFASGGDRWRVVRQNLTNIFTSSKMKAMFPLIEDCAKQFESLLDKDVTKSNELDAKFMMARFTMGCIGSCIFGVETGTLTDSKNKDNNIFMNILDLTKGLRNYIVIFMFYFRAMWPGIFYGLRFKGFSPRLLKCLHDMVTGVFKSRNYKPTNRNDFIDMVLEFAKGKYITGDSLSNMKTGENKKVQLEVNDDLLVAQCIVMFVAGFETSATTSSFVLYELSKNREALKKAQAEVDSYLKKHNGKVGYECTSELPYLEACIDEALRLYPVLGLLTREVVEDYKFSNGLQLEAGGRVHIPVRYLHRNPEFFPEPEKYKPERFLNGNKKNIIPYTYMPFGEGPRTCIVLYLYNVLSLVRYITAMIVQAILIVLCSVLYGIYALSKSKFDYWKKKNVPYKKPTPIFGNYGKFMLFKRSLAEVAEDISKEFPNEPYVGTFYGSDPALLLRDPSFIKTVMTKDFYYFSSRENEKYNHKELVTQNVFASGGDRWRVIRQNLTNIFTSSKMKAMFPLIEDCAKQFESLLDKDVAKSNELDAKFMMARFTMGCIGSCIFGVETGTLTDSKDKDNNIFMNILDLTKGLRNYIVIFMMYFRAMWPGIFYGLGFKGFSPRLLKCLHDMVTGVFKSRNYKPTNRNDFIDVILEFAKGKYITGDSLSNMKTGENKKVQLEVNDDLLVAQCLIMFVAGFETSATTSSFILYELSKNREALKKAQAEVDSYLKKHNGKVGYECTSELPYLEACIDEALRLYPVLGLLTREVVEDYKFSNGLQLEAGGRVHIPVRYLHRNPEFFPEPEKYKPERFLNGNKKNIIPYTYMPFGEGPRTCIGMRFAKMQMLPGLITILKKYDLELADGIPTTPEIDPLSIIVSTSHGIRLKCTLRQGWETREFTASEKNSC